MLIGGFGLCWLGREGVWVRILSDCYYEWTDLRGDPKRGDIESASDSLKEVSEGIGEMSDYYDCLLKCSEVTLNFFSLYGRVLKVPFSEFKDTGKNPTPDICSDSFNNGSSIYLVEKNYFDEFVGFIFDAIF